MHCPYCQNEVPDGTQICPICHADIAASLRRTQGTNAYSSASGAQQHAADGFDASGSSRPSSAYPQASSAQGSSQGGYASYQGGYAQQEGSGYGASQNASAQNPGGQNYAGPAQPSQPSQPAQPSQYPQQGTYPQQGQGYSAGQGGYQGQGQTQPYPSVPSGYPQNQAPSPQANVNQPQNPAGQGAYAPRAVPAKPAVQQTSQQVQQNLRSFDTKSMNSTPKWPIVLIVILVVVIIAAILLLIFKPWVSTSTSTGTVVTSQAASSAQDNAFQSDASNGTSAANVSEGAASGESDGTDASSGTATGTVTSEADAYATLSAAYSSADGFNSSISALAQRFNAEDLLDADQATRQAAIDDGNAVLTQIQAQIDALNAITLADDSQYTQTLSNMKTIYNDLYHRMDTLVRALTATISGGGVDEANQIIAADNDSNGISIYKAEYDELYPVSAPAAPSA